MSGVRLLCSISISDIACMKTHPEREWCVPPLLDFDHWHCLHENPSRTWVACASSAWFWSLTLAVWNPIQRVSGMRLLCFISMADIACMKSHPASEWCAPPLLDFDCWHCLHEIPSRTWVACASSARCRSLTLPAWNPIQLVSGLLLLCSISIADIACMKSHPDRKWCVHLLLDFNHWHCLHEIPSRLSVVSASSAWFQLLTLPAWNPMQRVSDMSLCSISITDIAHTKSHPGSEWCAPPLLDFDLWHIILFILQFVATLLSSLLLTPLTYLRFTGRWGLQCC